MFIQDVLMKMGALVQGFKYECRVWNRGCVPADVLVQLLCAGVSERNVYSLASSPHSRSVKKCITFVPWRSKSTRH